MRLPAGCDMVDLAYAIDAALNHRRLDREGLNRRGLRAAKKAQKWFWSEFVKAVDGRTAGLKRKSK